MLSSVVLFSILLAPVLVVTATGLDNILPTTDSSLIPPTPDDTTSTRIPVEPTTESINSPPKRIKAKRISKPSPRQPSSNSPSDSPSTVTVDLENAISKRKLDAIIKGTSFHLSESRCRTVSRELGKPYNQKFLDAILANPYASAKLDYKEMMHGAITNQGPKEIAQKVAEKAPAIGRICWIVSIAASWGYIDTIRALLKRKMDLDKTFEDCRHSSGSPSESLTDLTAAIVDLGTNHHYSEQSILVEMIPIDIRDQALPKDNQMERYVNLSWKAQQIDAVWRYYQTLGMQPTPPTKEEGEFVLLIVKDEERVASLAAMKQFLEPFREEMMDALSTIPVAVIELVIECLYF